MLYERIIGQGTINEPGGKPNPQFSLPATLNWMRALRLLSEDEPIDFESSTRLYANREIGRRPTMTDLEANTIFEQLFLSLHHLSAVYRFTDNTLAADHARVGILAWYYGISNAASAMTAAQTGSFQEDHAGTARLWDEHIASRELAAGPFGWRVDSLVEVAFQQEIERLSDGSTGTLQIIPTAAIDARGAAAQYLSGTAKWYASREKDRVKESQQFKNLGVTTFHTRRAQEIRDQHLNRKSIGFLHQAVRYRGKANYREALFLAYGHNKEDALSAFIGDMYEVLKAFLSMSGAFAARKLGRELWEEFVADVDENRAFSLRATDVWA